MFSQIFYLDICTTLFVRSFQLEKIIKFFIIQRSFTLLLNVHIQLHTFKVAPKKEVDENDKAVGDKKDAVTIDEKKEAPLATPEA